MADEPFKLPERKRITIASDTDQPEPPSTLLGPLDEESPDTTAPKPEIERQTPPDLKPPSGPAVTPLKIGIPSGPTSLSDITIPRTSPTKTPQAPPTPLVPAKPTVSDTPTPIASPEAPAPEADTNQSDDITLANDPAPSSSDEEKAKPDNSAPTLSEEELRKLQKTYHIPIDKIARRQAEGHTWLWVSGGAVGLVIGAALIYFFILS